MPLLAVVIMGQKSLTQNIRRLTMEEPATYRITVQGHLAESWSDRLGSINVASIRHTTDVNQTILVGEIPDQAALFGVLNLLYDFALALSISGVS